MCLGHEYENPFAKFDPEDPSTLGSAPQLKRDRAPQSTGENDMPAISTEPWSNRGFYSEYSQIADPLHTMNEGLVHTVAQNWSTIAATLQVQHGAFSDAIARVTHWKGEGSEAAQQAMATYAVALVDLHEQTRFMSEVMQNAANVINVSKNSIPTTSEVNSRLADAGATYAQRDSAKQQLLDWAAKQMETVYDKGVRQVATAAPMFGAPTSRGGSGMPSVSGGGGGGITGGGGGGVSMPSGGAATLPSLMKQSTTPTTPEVATPGATTTAPAGLTSGLQQAAGLGSSAANQAQSAVDKLKSLGNGPLTTPAGLHALDALKKGMPGGIAGLLKGGGGGGGAGKGGASLGKLGGALRGLSELEKAALTRGAKAVADLERSALSAARGASPTAAGPMGGGGGRGAGGEDKEHKANKFLRTTANGEELVGAPPAVTAAVIKEA
ncbi:hypothetical protein [Gordonia rhizosphera]|uniref:PPE family domain-containing protein n=1 Tax=Gordonia rhizosphera NBRC 16068 TaxID=1108045 RepID=K6VQF6_9ACTN|nr:hypothetical protein [Gordonia rhizosphera]GAB89145.1 hypothetical protein GORHZ_052_00130 [Gordonia rhizosphera NBRC 16068]